MKNLRQVYLIASFVVCILLFGFICNVQAASRMDEIKERGYLIVGIGKHAPFAFTDDQGNHKGFDIDVAQYIADKLGVPIKKFVDVGGAARITSLEDGAVDLVASTMTHTKSRDLKIDYSITYFYDGQKILVKKGSGYKSYRDLAGKNIGTTHGTTSERNIARLQPSANIVPFEIIADALRALDDGIVDAVTNDSTLLLGIKADSQNPGDYEIVGEFFSEEPYGLGVQQNDSKWRDFVNECLIEMWNSGEWKKIYNEYFGPGKKYELPLDFKMSTWPLR